MIFLLKKIHNIWNIKDLRKKIFTTLWLLLIYRFGAYIPIPGINPSGIKNFIDNLNIGSKGLVQILSSFTGGAFNRASIFALGIMPYISSSIIVQLMCIIIPSLNKLQKEGETGKKQIHYITRLLTICICLIQAPIYLISLTGKFMPFYSSNLYKSIYLLDINTFNGKLFFCILGVFVLTSGTLFIMWLGDKITDNGIGNGVSIIIMSGIIARFPDAITKEIIDKIYIGNKGIIILFFEFILWLLVIFFSIMIVQSVRKIPLQYVSNYKNLKLTTSIIYKKNHNYIPLKMISAGVMPLIFSQAIMLFPLTFYNYINNDKIKNFFYIFHDIYGLYYNITIFLLVIILTFFYTKITIPVNNISDDLKRNGGYIPKIKPGIDTAKYINKILFYITIPGSILLGIIAILPSIIFRLGVTRNFSLFYGGTSLLIVVGVILDIIQQVDIHLLNNYYDVLMMTTKNR